MTMRFDLSPIACSTILALWAAFLVGGAGPAHAAPKVGQPAPDFRFEARVDGDTKTYRLSDYVGEGARKKGVVVAWFPKAFTPG